MVSQANFSITNIIFSLILVTMLVISAYIDIKGRKIPNYLTLGGAALGLGINTVLNSWDGSLSSIIGWLTGFALLIVFYLIGAMGAGDVKLLAAVGAIGGPTFALNAFVFMGLAGGVLAVVLMVYRRNVRYALASIGTLLYTLVFSQQLPAREDPRTSSLGLPYGVAITIGAITALFVQVF